jgi:hypothetical protein
MAKQVRVFFYGSFINRQVLAAVGLVPDRVEVVRLWGFDIHYQPLITLVPSDRTCVYGIICETTHAELDRLYHQEWLGTYLPEAVIVQTQEGRLLPALSYIAPEGPAATPAGDYVDRITGPARDYGFPDWYVKHLESFRRREENGG